MDKPVTEPAARVARAPATEQAPSRRNSGALAGLLAGARLKHLLFAALLTVSLVPAGLLSYWVRESAFAAEMAAVRDRHLQIARNLSAALSRYATDAEAAFRLAVAEIDRTPSPALSDLLRTLHFQHLCILGPGGVVESFLEGRVAARGERVPAPLLERLREAADRAGNRVAFTGVMLDPDGRPALYLVQNRPDGRLAMAQLATDYISEQQRAVAFGRGGHSAVVDNAGRVIAHPNSEWMARMHDISRLPPVAQMLRGESGVATFFSPAVGVDMVAGFAPVPRAGWGVMVPQPVPELRARADASRSAAFIILALGVSIAAALSWLLAGALAAPARRVAEAAAAVRGGRTEARVASLPALAPREMHDMAAGFNAMLDELHRRNELLMAAASKAHAASVAKSQFLANVSHELRTPLNAVIGFCDLLRDQRHGPLGDARYADYVAHIHQAGANLLATVEQVLSYAGGETGGPTVHPAPFTVESAAAGTVRMMDGLARQRGVTVTLNCHPNLAPLTSDAAKFAQILLNLLSNAVKFSERGGRVSVNLQPDAAPFAIRLVVSDTGVGIAAADLNRVMEPFERIGDVYRRSQDGAGLGLPLTRLLADALQAEFELDSTPGRGTTATVRLPNLAERSPSADPAIPILNPPAQH